MAADPLAALLGLPGVADQVAAAGAAVDRLLAHRVLRRQSAAVSVTSAVRGGWASAVLAGAAVPLAALSVEPARLGSAARSTAVVADRFAAADQPPGDGGPVVRGALRATGAVGQLVGTWERAPLQVLARLHVLAAADLVPADRLGRPSGDPAVAARLAALARLATGGTGVPAVVFAAVVHGELASIEPFGSADGIVARAAARIVIVSRGLDPKSVTVPEIGHLEHRPEYSAALAAYATGTPDGVATWLRHCCVAVALGAREGLAISEALQRG